MPFQVFAEHGYRENRTCNNNNYCYEDFLDDIKMIGIFTCANCSALVVSV